MTFSKITATALLALGATALSAGIVHADSPAQLQPAPRTVAIHGNDHGVGYLVALSDDQRSAVTTLRSGRFVAATDTVTLLDDAGRTVTTLPLAFDVAGQRVELLPTVDAAGRQLTLSPVGAAATPLHDISAQDTFWAEFEKAKAAGIAGLVIGAAIGAVLGFPLGLFVLDFITVPVAAVVGGVIGGLAGLAIGGGQPLIDAAVAYASGQP
ncbi:hypothetical protein [Nocardia sp. CC201C]|uniref:hypothetical protein n=1 Tax=Nocardia sp. CC201C TaxID=3044575 RepID=UPI0024A7E496|nr:hypothetical protein [Nocardia sp. CC201C]